MFGFDTSNKYGTTIISGPIEVKKSEVDMFQRINTDRRKVELFAGKIRREEEEYEKFSDQDDCVLSVLFLKEKHFENIKKIFKKGSSVVKAVSLMVDTPRVVSHAWDVIDKNLSEISLMTTKLIGFDLSLEEEQTYLNAGNDQSIVVPESKKINISSMLSEFSVPENISKDVEEIYNEGFNMETMGSIFISIVTYFFNKKYTQNNFASKNQKKVDLDDEE